MKEMTLLPGTGLALAGFLLSAAAVCAAALSGFGYRWEWWAFRQGFTILRWAAWSGLGAAGLALAGGLIALANHGRTGLFFGLAGVAAGLCVSAWTWHLARAAKSVPAIHDITTDTDRPPLFSAIVPLRAGAANSLDYGGAEVATLQRAAYPDLRPLILPLPPEQAFGRARDAARELGWTLVAENRQEGRIEAFDRTFWYGFVDDVVVRVTPEASGSRIDVRSVSRVGRGDVGANARRIRRFLAEVGRGVGGSSLGPGLADR